MALLYDLTLFFRAGCNARVWTLTPFSRLQLCRVAKQESSLGSLFSPIDLSILQVWSFVTSCRTDSLLLVSVSGPWKVCVIPSQAVISLQGCYCCRYSTAPLSLASLMKQHISRHFMAFFFFFLQGAVQILTLGILAFLPPLWYCSSFLWKPFRAVTITTHHNRFPFFAAGHRANGRL